MTGSSPGPDLTGFAGLLGESFSSRVALLERIIKGSHYPSLGRYKERLLANAIREYLPGNTSVGSGFVVFPALGQMPKLDLTGREDLNRSSYEISRQCDIIIYDSAAYPPVFRDDDVVVVRPESVHGIIEVKGALSRRDVTETLQSFHDFGQKWRNTQLFYADRHQPLTRRPGLYLMAWDYQRDTRYRPTVAPPWIMRTIADFYARTVPIDAADGYPFLELALIHNSCEIAHLINVEDGDEGTEYCDGWRAADGRFVRPLPDGSFIREKDRTISQLLSSLHTKTTDLGYTFNRFFSHLDETNYEALPFKYSGFACAYHNPSVENARHLSAETLLMVDD